MSRPFALSGIPLPGLAKTLIILVSPKLTIESLGAPMPKQKTHKASKKRFRVTANGKVMHRQAGTSHLLSRMTHKRKRNLRGTTALCKVEATRIKRALAGNSY